ncbi:polysaccharide biosynthesis C-terminal domain-containing protein [Haemophilus parainfluenzae]|uniref:Polysaccharide biosynthesis protein n=1 Tax=Haemophilus parainfluenzae HK2019 TaxID=1095746 RepID=A0ABN0EVC8_HAEPA|nr:polysaccharide biosynthesis C-terminal domain-containing protein [Haemophilus parainfluenzae]EIF38897.1 polysaccharide biosynthesis protein [Haemophilus parainfluenzae HK262]EIJ30617.1 polysaccharide biosynthesis protein [Haemophilus parainfluenzae HK2019]OBX70950.1 polysaccharide biosynthesis protein [Haemophilus parainfluenzae]OBX73984.1 polysaccharide biosynthesis protein [Haemophilus parainfluenzae]
MKDVSITINFIMRMLRILIGGVFTFFLLKFSTNIFSPVEIGEIDYANTIILYISSIASLGINNYGIRETALVSNNKERLSYSTIELLLIIFITTLIGYVVLFLMIYGFGFFSNIKTLLLIMSINILLMNLGINWFYIGIEEQTFITIRFVIVRFVVAILLLLLVHDENDFILYVILYTSIEGGMGILNILFLPKRINFRIDFRKLDLRRHIRPLLTIFVGSISIIIYNQLNVVMLSSYYPDRVAFFSIPNQVIYFIIVLVTLLVPVLMPKVVQAINQRDYDVVDKYSVLSLQYILFFALPIICYIMAMSKDITLMLSSESFLDAQEPFRYFSLTILLVAVNNFFGLQILYSYNKEKIYSLVIFITLLINIILNFLFIPIYRENGVVISAIFSELLKALLLYFYCRRFITSINLFSFRFFKYFIASLIMLAPIYRVSTLDLTYTMSISLSFFIGGLSYLLTLYLLKEELVLLCVKKISYFIKRF